MLLTRVLPMPPLSTPASMLLLHAVLHHTVFVWFLLFCAGVDNVNKCVAPASSAEKQEWCSPVPRAERKATTATCPADRGSAMTP